MKALWKAQGATQMLWVLAFDATAGMQITGSFFSGLVPCGVLGIPCHPVRCGEFMPAIVLEVEGNLGDYSSVYWNLQSLSLLRYEAVVWKTERFHLEPEF